MKRIILIVLLCSTIGLFAGENNYFGVVSVTPEKSMPDQKILINDNIKGLAVKLYWKDIETSPGTYNWEYLDKFFTEAKNSNKFVHLSIIPGFYSPKWVIDSVQSGNFLVPGGEYKGTVQKLPVPWDSSYLAMFNKFLDAFAKKYDSEGTLKMLTITGPNSFSEEIEYPSDSSSQAVWKKVGGSTTHIKTLLVNAWFKTISNYNDIFKENIKLVMIPSLNCLPFANSTIESSFKNNILNYAVGELHNKAALQSNSVDARPLCPRNEPDPAIWNMIERYSDSIATGYGTLDKANLFNCEIPQDTLLYQSVKNAINNYSHYIEIPENILADDKMNWVVKFAADSIVERTKTGVGDLQNSSDAVEIYPNPAHSSIKVKTYFPVSSEITVTFFSILGEKIKVLNYSTEYDSEINISLEEIKTNIGLNSDYNVYFVQVSSNKYTVTKKLLVY